ncbi:MAG TPA: hypothetical protein VNR11_13280 [Xanthobacteraceae bacterium]|nr:hypothetical protein [Xanthobacteraceae bacterium]
MFRKLILAAAAVAALGAASLAPTAASAHGWHGHFHGHFHKHWGFYPTVYGGYGGDCYFVRKFVPTPYGLVKKRVMVCG